MTWFILGIVLLIVGLVLWAVPEVIRSRTLGRAVASMLFIVAIALVALSTAIYVDDDKGGIVIRKFGPDLPSDRVVAANGEKGPQATVLGPGWHFGYWPWLYDLTLVPTVTIPQGSLGIVSALDGMPLPANQVYAPVFAPLERLLDGSHFLKEGKGFRGPQLAVLTPGRYRYNPRLFDIQPRPMLTVDAGEVAVIKSNTGEPYKPTAGDDVEVVNGTALTPDGFRGIWRTPKLPGQYYLHPDAYSVIKVKTTNRTYVYQDKHWQIRVRSKDGFTFPVDVRVSVSISSVDAPHLVALLGNPDQVMKDDQEDEEISVMEARMILPVIRAVFRNVAETMNALQFVNSRSVVESDATAAVRAELARNRITTEGVFVGNIELDETEAGKVLLATQTDREVALNQQATFKEKEAAEEARARFVLAQEEAEQQKNLASAKYKVLVAEQEAKAREASALGEARAITITGEARKTAYEMVAQTIGADGVTLLESLKLVAEGNIQITPQVMVSGGASSGDALSGTMLARLLQEMNAQKAAATKAP
jgi:regulator of protease activity HflC (stomatin/prohibitin superfamily)